MSTATQANVICCCAFCREHIYEGDKMADKKVFDFEGDLDYIELAHVECAKFEIGINGYKGWEWD